MQMSANPEDLSLEVRRPRLGLDRVLSALLQRVYFASAALVHIEPDCHVNSACEAVAEEDARTRHS